MTYEEIMDLKPGPDMDRLLANTVMGWTVITSSNPRLYVFARSQSYSTGKEEATWHPSTHNAAAFEVVSHLQDSRVMNFYLQRLYCVGEMKWKATFTDINEDRIYSAFSFEPAAEAIGKAALLVHFGIHDSSIQRLRP